MSSRQPRRLAWEFLRDAERSDAYINLAIGDLHKKLHPQDRAFATELIFGSIRMRGLVDHLIDRLSDRDVDEVTRSVLRLALYEALMMRTAEHAVVNEYVEISKHVLGKARSGFINAIMRRALRERANIMDLHGLDLATRTSHPQWIVNAYRSVLEEERVEIELDSHNEPGEVHLVSFDHLDESVARKSLVTPFGYVAKVPPQEIEGVRRGTVFVQDEGSQILCEVALATDPTKSMRWLDLCAGPGGKFAYLAHFLPPSNLVGNELHQHRAELIRRRAPEHQINVGDGRRFPEVAKYDRIVIDAPCTGIGALRRRPDARWRRSEADLKSLVTLQRELLDHASVILAPGGVILYMTCSPHPLETKAQVNDFLSRHPDFKILPIKRENLATINFPSNAKVIDSKGWLQLFTSDFGSDAMFMAMLVKDRA
jgi:16S rRNA (cytosine967-C5)-methyltransferase